MRVGVRGSGGFRPVGASGQNGRVLVRGHDAGRDTCGNGNANRQEPWLCGRRCLWIDRQLCCRPDHPPAAGIDDLPDSGVGSLRFAVADAHSGGHRRKSLRD